MSIGSLGGFAASVAGSPLAQAKGPDVERTQQETAAQSHHAEGQKKAEAAAGIGETDGEEHQAADRDADGRRPWEIPVREPDTFDDEPAAPPVQGTAPDGHCGSLLDLSG
jgi:hypothetical protein